MYATPFGLPLGPISAPSSALRTYARWEYGDARAEWLIAAAPRPRLGILAWLVSVVRS